MHLNRRQFLGSTAALLATGLPSGSEDFGVGCGFLYCAGRCVGPGRWHLDFHLYVQHQRDGVEMERLLVGSELLKQRLREAGFPVEYEKDTSYPSLLCTLQSCPSPEEIQRRMERIVNEGHRLYVDPEPWEWERMYRGLIHFSISH
jgi:hypothetical protein